MRGFGFHGADDSGIDVAICEGGDGFIGVRGRDGDEKAAGRLRIDDESAEFVGNGRCEIGAAFDELAIVLHAGGEKAGAGGVDRSIEIGDFFVIELDGDAAADGHFAGVAEEAEAGDVCDRVDGGRMARFEIVKSVGGVTIERGHGGGCGGDPRGRGFLLFDRGGDHTGADGLGENERVAGLGADIFPDFTGMDGAGDGVAKLQFIVADGVATNDSAIRFRHFGEAAAENLFEDRGIAIAGKRENGERRDGTAAHGVDVAERVGGGDLAEFEGIVDDGREEVDRLHDGKIRSEAVNGRVVAGFKTDKAIGIGLRREFIERGFEDTRAEFRGATGGFGSGREANWLLGVGQGGSFHCFADCDASRGACDCARCETQSPCANRNYSATRDSGLLRGGAGDDRADGDGDGSARCVVRARRDHVTTALKERAGLDDQAGRIDFAADDGFGLDFDF